MDTVPPPDPHASGYRESNSTADRALTILAMFADDRLVLSASEVGQTLGVARSTAYRYLQSLVRSGFLEESPSGGFRLGLAVLQLARLARRGYGLSEVALPVLRTLAERYQQTVLLTRRVGSSIVCVEREEGHGQYIRLSYERGTRLPINAGASALILLAWLPEEEVRSLLGSAPLPAFTENTITDVSLLLDRLRQIRSDGYSVTHAEVDPEAMGIAAPVRGEAGEVVAAVSVVALHRRLPESSRGEVLAALLEAAETISTALQVVSS